jgi:FkbM family methyltransferase
LENDIFWSGITGKYEGKSLETWIKLAKNSNVIFDVGANTGVFALAASSSNPNAKVFAFEPLNAVYKKLEKNISLNNLDIIPVKKALSNTNGKQKIYISDNSHDYWASLSVQRLKDFSASKEEEIEKTDFVTFVESIELKKVDLLKIDVEYHEVEVLEGMRNYIEKWKPDMLIEIVDDETADKINKMIDGLNYKFFDINDVKMSIEKIEKVQRSVCHNILICKRESALAAGLI